MLGRAIYKASASMVSSLRLSSAHTFPLLHTPTIVHPTRSFSFTPTVLGLEDFFDSSKGWVWNEKELPTGRAWLAAELRNKSFDDLHSLWWVCCKEKNKLYSQQMEARRFDIFFPHKDRIQQVKLTMSRLKLVIWERREAWMQAQAILKTEQARQELLDSGMSTEEVEDRLVEMFPVPIVDSGKAVERKRWTMKTSRTMTYRTKKSKAKNSNWSVV
ncbi:hypothetical protein BATDEDRAFT_28225 [Batrachochytrium dendrobatidis JAM81]|uniref:Large ribosomal subunit protein uL29m n=2 Tax=Batrachochytrium dendrobatidis TaxID=109871 RepID=F4PDC6_BATDJ|nr:mitochondrial 54S ribosomal protein YmL4 [Batrachochytrium dendrobatidis JAM81]EGF76766.1 hypothetical protein BATDEDRAFT_28225 [Batrachochytrium dendrobatidis JAM81]KAJ8329183.1 39S ribosomal protein L47, mitochondrial [Batrachochytrium dendrobatidis]KAK5670045.1 39S ribosomal protein L47, mitochondrial [Batrachochytrium dendrobatidis]OAJ45289.1 hypothetical protein BDEG_28439 [Batrachochytrium dendrobatidis JEL423]|eukprot:XP_006682596.1 hypothetical protein BATDEDRAFT_28225 [Batrachochytrium dendrobatidis JAM81]